MALGEDFPAVSLNFVLLAQIEILHENTRSQMSKSVGVGGVGGGATKPVFGREASCQLPSRGRRAKKKAGHLMSEPVANLQRRRRGGGALSCAFFWREARGQQC